jgi:hypothetical protein
MIGVALALTAGMGDISEFLATGGLASGLLQRTFESTVHGCGLDFFAASFLLWMTLDTLCFMEHAAKTLREESLGGRPAGASHPEDALNDDEVFFNAFLEAVEGPVDVEFDDRFREAESPPRAARRSLPRIVTPDKSVAMTQ